MKDLHRHDACPRFPARTLAMHRALKHARPRRWPVSGLTETTPVAFPVVGTTSGVSHRSWQALACLPSAYRCGGSAGGVASGGRPTFLLPV